MQCSRCKLAYYCSSKCMAEHLSEHSKFCSKAGVVSDRHPVPPVSKSTRFDEQANDSLTVFDWDSDDESSGAEHGKSLTMFFDESGLDSDTIADSEHEDSTTFNSAGEDFGDANSERSYIRGEYREIEVVRKPNDESVELRHTETVKRDIAKFLPEWANFKLKPTSQLTTDPSCETNTCLSMTQEELESSTDEASGSHLCIPWLRRTSLRATKEGNRLERQGSIRRAAL